MISHDLPGAQPSSLWRFRYRKGIVAETDECLEDGAEVCAPGGGEQSGDVLEDGESGILPIGSAPHFSDHSDCLKKEAAALAFAKSGLFPGDGLILAVVDNDPVRDIAVVVRHGQIVHALQLICSRDFANRVPCVSTESYSAFMYRNADAYSIGVALIDNPAFNNSLRRARVEVNRCEVS